MNKVLKSFFAAVLIALVALTAACSDSTDPDTPDTGSISGTVTFDGTWPAAGEIQVSVYADLNPPFVPTGAPTAFTDPLAANLTSYDFKFEGLDKATYAAVFVSWRDPSNPAASRLLGMYWSDPDSSGISAQTGLPVTMPTPITISDNSLNVTNINITADLSLAP